MRVIGVIDLKAERAVHARGGRREGYEPVQSVLLSADQAGDAAALARAYRDVLGLEEIYVADLDCIDGQSGPSRALSAVYAATLPAMVDAGVTTPQDAAALIADGATRVVVGLETLTSFEELECIVREVGPERVVFSLDCRGPHLLVRDGIGLNDLRPLDVASRAVAAGVRAVLVLDLGRVGQSSGPDLPLIQAVRSEMPGIEVLAGGGIRDDADLERLAAVGCNGALVGTALHGGTIKTGTVKTGTVKTGR